VRSANTLIIAGQELACAALKKAAKSKWDVGEWYNLNQKICHLCCLVFVPKASNLVLRCPLLGWALLGLLDLLRDTNGLQSPLVIVDGVPLSMTDGYELLGLPEKSDDYLAYCISNGVFRTALFPGVNINTAGNALSKILDPPEWKAERWPTATLISTQGSSFGSRLRT
jgi:hypothetical protein